MDDAHWQRFLRSFGEADTTYPIVDLRGEIVGRGVNHGDATLEAARLATDAGLPMRVYTCRRGNGRTRATPGGRCTTVLPDDRGETVEDFPDEDSE